MNPSVTWLLWETTTTGDLYGFLPTLFVIALLLLLVRLGVEVLPA